MKTYNQKHPHITALTRRTFVLNTAKVIGASVLLSAPLVNYASTLVMPDEGLTAGQIMDLFIKDVPGGAIANTVDTLKAGNRNIKVTGVVTTMFATIEVINKAIALNANFIIAHEPAFYNHADETTWLENDAVYQYKAKLLKDNNIAVWRNHDYVHSLAVDGVAKTLAQQLGLLQNGFSKNGFYDLNEALTLKQLIAHAKQKLGIEMLRYNGDLSLTCKKVLLLPGAWGGKNQIQAISKLQPDAAK
jgi:hypothetical protein